MIYKVKGVIKEYDWGSKDFLPALFGYEANGKPQAEAWFGCHPAGEATLEDGSKLSDLIKSSPKTLLGKACADKYGTLPLLLKVLAINDPLSIQCHPDIPIAKQGYANEAPLREKGVPSSELNYKDDNQKAEVIYALTPLTAMCAFRPFIGLTANLKRVIPASFEKHFSDKTNAKDLFETLYTLNKEDLHEVITELIENMEKEPVSPDPAYLSEKDIVLKAYSLYGDDPGLLCPYMLNIVHLKTGEALYLTPRTLHAYVKGNGVELMSLSDNVLRGGLTHKKVDVPELMKVMVIESSGDKSEKQKLEDGRVRVLTPTEEFALCILEKGEYNIEENAASLLLCLDGKTLIEAEGKEIVLEKGDCAFIPFAVAPYSVKSFSLTIQALVPNN